MLGTPINLSSITPLPIFNPSRFLSSSILGKTQNSQDRKGVANHPANSQYDNEKKQ